MRKKYDFLLKNGLVVDPANSIEKVMDVAVKSKKIAAVSENISESEAEKVFDLQGLIVTPGLIDSHIHCYFSAGMPKAWAGDYSLQPDYFTFPSGVTTAIDVGTSGSYNFEHFKTTVIDRAQTRIFALLNIADYGMSTLYVEQFPGKNDFNSFIRVANEYSDVIKGIKIAHYWGKDWADVEYAKKAQGKFPKPIMVDFGVFAKERPYDELVMSKLERGDISTHCFRSAVPVIDNNGKVYSYLFKARDRGILFDLGHGCASFMTRNGVPAMNQGFLPDFFSTDLHALSANGTAYNLCNVLSKMWACCKTMTLTDLFSRVTDRPAAALDLKGLGTLSVGADADIAVFTIREDKFGFQDMSGGKVTSDKRIECEMTFRNGDLVYDINGRAAVHYQFLDPLYGFNPATEDLITPTYY